MEKFASAHPVITKIDKKQDNNYVVHETLKIGFIPFSFTYPVKINENLTENTIIMCATVMKLTTIKMTFVLTPDNVFTNIEEHIEFKTFLPITSIMKRIFTTIHIQLFKNIEKI